MSSSSRNATGRVRLSVLATLASTASGLACAADVYVQPIVSLATAYNTNVFLEPKQTKSAEGYYADAATNIGIATPTSDTTLQPRILYNYYPTVGELDRLEGFLNLHSRYSWQRDLLEVVGFYDHRNDVNAEQPEATFNPVNPGVGGTTPSTGQINKGITRDYLIVDPTFTHRVTPLTSLGASAEYQRMSYSLDDPAHVGFNYYMGKLFASHAIGVRSELTAGVYGSRYNSSSDVLDATSTSGGVEAGGTYNWSEPLRSSLTLQYQQTKFKEQGNHNVELTTRPWSAIFGTVYTGQVASYRLDIGRSIAPSSIGGLYTTDQVRLQYDRDYSPRLHFTGAVRAFKARTTGGVFGDDTRNYATGSLKLQYMLRERLFVAGTYTYIYEKYHFQPDMSDANMVFLQIGYQGLPRQR